jgi:hypothetical protein
MLSCSHVLLFSWFMSQVLLHNGMVLSSCPLASKHWSAWHFSTIYLLQLDAFNKLQPLSWPSGSSWALRNIWYSCLWICCVNVQYVVRVGQNHIYTVYIRYFLQGIHQIYGHIRWIYTVLANPIRNVHRSTVSDVTNEHGKWCNTWAWLMM